LPAIGCAKQEDSSSVFATIYYMIEQKNKVCVGDKGAKGTLEVF